MRKTLGTLRLRLIGGRFLDEQDNHDAPMAAVINESFAGRFSRGKTRSGRSDSLVMRKRTSWALWRTSS